MNRSPLNLESSLRKESVVNRDLALKRLDFIYAKKSMYWDEALERTLLEIFHFSAKNIPAYRAFLKQNKIDPKKITNFSQLREVPSLSKDSYLRKHSWKDLCEDHALDKLPLVLTSTSGSTGAPFYFPRTQIVDAQSSLAHEMFVRNSKLDKNKSTLVLVCFGMGVWIGGIITYQAFKSMAERGWPISLLTPGVNKREIFEALRSVAPKYDQVIVCGYPPFIKDIIDEAPDNGINLKALNIRIIFAAEAFSETFRDYIAKKVGIKNPLRGTMNIYGSADLGTMAQETPVAILIRRLALKNPTIYRKLFHEATRLPTFAQFIPEFICFESRDRVIRVSGKNVMPLFRYEIGDHGGVRTFSEVRTIFSLAGLDLDKEIQKAGIKDTIAELPFVYIYERIDLSTKLYGAIIYPEHIRAGLQCSNLNDFITGKFTIFTLHDKNQNEYLEVNVELKPGVKPGDRLANSVRSHIIKGLIEGSAEYKNNLHNMPGRVEPHVVFWPHEHPKHFQPGIKQRWVKKEGK